MSFLNNEGLAYFYNKLKSTPIPYAENLVNEEATVSEENFIYRTSAGDKNIDSGNAFLYSIKGAAKVTGKVEEKFEPNATNGLAVEINSTLWKNTYPTSGTYTFQYIANTFSGDNAVASVDADEVWRYNGSDIVLSARGISVLNLVKSNLSVDVSNSEISVTFKPETYLDNIDTLETKIFNYDENLGWCLNDSPITPNNYGINVSGTAVQDDSFSIVFSQGTESGYLIITYTAPQYGSITIATPSKFVSTGFNQFDFTDSSSIIPHATISNGSIVALDTTDSGYNQKYVCFCRETPGADFGYIAYSKTNQIDGIGWCTSTPTIGLELNTQQTEDDLNTSECASIQPDDVGYVVVATRNYSDLCIHTRWDTEEDKVFEHYETPSEIALPTISVDSQLLPLGFYGMPAVGSVADELDLERGLYIQRIGVTPIEYLPSIGSAEYITDGTDVYYVLPSSLNYSVGVSPSYVVNDFGTEEFTNTTLPISAKIGYTENLRNKLKGDVLTISNQNKPLSPESIESAMKNLGWEVAREW